MGRASRSGGHDRQDGDGSDGVVNDDVIQPLAKAMANNEKRIRDKAVRNLRRWLSYRKNVSRLDLMKVWKALFYCMWMSDKRPIQQELAKTISELVHCFRDTEDAMSFVACFYDTINREWGGLDRLRMDKFLSLIRNVFCQTLVYVIRKDWEDESLNAMICIVLKQMQTRNGLRRHLVDIFWNEIDRSLQIGRGRQENKQVGISNEIWSKLIDPFAAAASLCIDRSFQSHVVENIFEILLEKNDELQLIRPSFKLVSNIIFEIASDPDTVEIHRKKLYNLRRRFRKRSAKEPVIENEVVVDVVEKKEESVVVVEEEEHEKMEKENDDEEEEKKTKKKKKKKKKRKMSNITTPTTAEKKQKKGVHFELQNNIEKSVTELKKALHTPRPPTRKIKGPTSGILKRRPATDPLKRSTEVVPKTPRRSTRKRKKRRL